MMKYKIGPNKFPPIAKLAVIPAVIGTNVNQNNASPIPPKGPIAATRTARIELISAFCCSMDNTIPITNVTKNG